MDLVTIRGLKKKSPDHIVQIDKIQNELSGLEETKRRADRHHWGSIAHRELPTQIESLKNQLSDLQKRREPKRVGFKEERVRVFDKDIAPNEVGKVDSEVHPI